MKKTLIFLCLLGIPTLQVNAALKRASEDTPAYPSKMQEVEGLPMHIDWKMVVRHAGFRSLDEIKNIDTLACMQDTHFSRNTRRAFLQDGSIATHVKYGVTDSNTNRALALQMAKEFDVDPKTLHAANVFAYYEYLIMSKMRPHPNIISLVGFVDPTGFDAAILYKFIDGCTLQEILNCYPEFSLAEQLNLALGITSGLQHIHEYGFNVCLDADHIKVTDELKPVICYTQRMRIDNNDSQFTQLTRCFAGQIQDIRKIIPDSFVVPQKSDIYCLGTILWQIATRKIPGEHVNMNHYTVAQELKSGKTLPIPDDIDPVLKDIITRCWNFDPNKRPTAKEIVAILQQRLKDLSGAMASEA